MPSFALKNLTLAFVFINFANSFFVFSTTPGVQPELFNLFASKKVTIILKSWNPL